MPHSSPLPETTGQLDEFHQLPKGKLRLLGIDFSPAQTDEERMADLTAFRDATSGDRLDASKLPSVRVPARPVFADQTGARFTYAADSTGQMVPVPISESPRIDLKDGVPEAGGFVSQKHLKSMQPSSGGPSPTDIIAAAMMQRILREGLSPNDDSKGASSRGNPILDRLQGIALSQLEQKAAGVLASGIIGGSVLDGLDFPSLGDLADGLMGLGINQALDFGAEAILSKFFAVDDTSSGGEFLEAEAAKKLMEQFKSEVAEFLGKQVGLDSEPAGDSLSAQVNDVLGTPKAGLPLARTGDTTPHVGTVIGGAAKTVVGGVAVARATDQQVCPIPGPPPHKGGPIRQGNPTVIIEGLPAAAYTHEAICEGCGAITTLMPLMMDVEIGTQLEDVIPKPVPPVQSVGAAATAAGAGGAGGGAGAKAGGEAGKEAGGTGAGGEAVEGVNGAGEEGEPDDDAVAGTDPTASEVNPETDNPDNLQPKNDGQDKTRQLILNAWNNNGEDTLAARNYLKALRDADTSPEGLVRNDTSLVAAEHFMESKLLAEQYGRLTASAMLHGYTALTGTYIYQGGQLASNVVNDYMIGPLGLKKIDYYDHIASYPTFTAYWWAVTGIHWANKPLRPNK